MGFRYPSGLLQSLGHHDLWASSLCPVFMALHTVPCLLSPCDVFILLDTYPTNGVDVPGPAAILFILAITSL